MKNHIYRIFCVVLVVMISILGINAGKGEADTVTQLKLLPDKDSFLDPNYLYVDILVETGSDPVNAVLAGLDFDNSKLSLEAVQYEQSFCSFFIYENIDNLNAHLEFACANSEPVSEGNYLTATLVFKKISSGWARFTFSDSSAVLAHNGSGTDLLQNTEVHTLYIMK